jgi:hypothetical protein
MSPEYVSDLRKGLREVNSVRAVYVDGGVSGGVSFIPVTRERISVLLSMAVAYDRAFEAMQKRAETAEQRLAEIGSMLAPQESPS